MERPKFNIFDVFMLFVIVIVVAGGVWFITTRGDGMDTTVQIVVEFTNQPQDFVDSIVFGGEIRDSIRNFFLGYVMDVRVEPATRVTFNHEISQFVLESIPDRYDIYLTIVGYGTENPSFIRMEGQEKRVGQEVFLRGRGYAGIGFITEISTAPREDS